MTRPHARRLPAAAIVAGAVLAAIAGRGAAWAGDPPGFPSTGSASAGSASAQASNLEDVARARIAALKKFVRDKEADPRFAEHEGHDRACRIDHDARLVTLTFSADGVLHCKLAELAEGYRLEIYVLTVKDLYSTGNHYRVTVAPGAPLKSVPVHGTTADVRATIEVLGGYHAEYTDADWWRAPARYGPFHFETGTITIALDEAGVTEETKLAIAPLYPFNLAVAAIVGPGLPSYALFNGKITESRNRADLDYYFGIHFYPLSWHRNGKNQARPGRYFNDDYSSWIDRVSLLAGINLSHPTEAGYLGGAIEVYSGVSITGGWQPRKFRQLQSGNAVGDAIVGDQVPTDSAWKLSGWGVGLTVDATLLRPLLSLVGK